ncbi:MAG TPA: pyridoxal phosphate-dependent aminotransferase, partial [Planctomycetia bacterium]|nr:pyridoxal phosphate-dependent aminotransferase [Planctomycetia bacterium]
MGMVNPTIAASMGAASWIRRTFELARKLRAESPNEPLHDFSLGNPHLEPPEAVLAQLRKLLAERHPGAHRYMTTAGLPETRAAVAAACSRRERVEV